MIFRSILFDRAEDGTKAETAEAPEFFVDLNLDQIVDAVTAAKQEYDLKPFFYVPLRDIDAIRYRHEIMQDLENTPLYDHVKAFAQKMRAMREHLAQSAKLYYKHQKESWFLDAVELYCDAIDRLIHDLSRTELKSRGFLAFREYLAQYAQSALFAALAAHTKRLKADLAAVRYCVLIKGGGFTVCKSAAEIDYSADVERTFEKFKQGAAKDYKVNFPAYPEMNHIEAKVLEFVARLYPETFSDLDDYAARNVDYVDRTIAVFDREIQFYLAYLEHAACLKRAGLQFCYPRIADEGKEIHGYEAFDLGLAQKLIGEKSPIVCNDFHLKGRERILVVSGPNQGGKTTFARTFGQLHYLASLGCPVPGREAQLFLFDRLLTHFENKESIETLRGKLQDDLMRIHHMLNQATSRSVVIMNEIFTSTTLQDALFLSERIMQRLVDLDSLCVWVTFIDELASFSEEVVSMTSTVVPENPTLRTYKIVRRPADGLAYAMSIAEKYRVIYDRLRERLGS